MKFNLVGALGVGVQLLLLAMLNRAWRLPYLAATAVAVELTVLHNFFWHVRYTWRERKAALGFPVRLLRFHLSNGLVSLVGNVVLMAVLAGRLRLPMLLANILSIVTCSITNFFLADRWVFGRRANTA